MIIGTGATILYADALKKEAEAKERAKEKKRQEELLNEANKVVNDISTLITDDKLENLPNNDNITTLKQKE